MPFEDRGIHGIDLSFYQGSPKLNLFVDFQIMKARGAKFAIIKVGQRDYVDPAFAYNWTAAKVASMPRGAYWFLDDERDGKFQAELFWSLLQDDPGEGPLVVDYEWGSGTDWRRVYDFVVRLGELSGYPKHRIWIYTGYYYWLDHGPKLEYQLEFFKDYGLWMAAYLIESELQKVVWEGKPVDITHFNIPRPWDFPAMWQIGTPVAGLEFGAHSLEIDYNVFNGGVVEFTRYFNLNDSDPVVDPPEGGTVRVIQGTAIGSVKRRASPGGAEFVPPRYLIAGDKIEADRNEFQWLHLTKINDAPVTGDEWASAGSSEQYIQWDWVDIPDPTPVPPESKAFSFKVAGYKEVSGFLEPE